MGCMLRKSATSDEDTGTNVFKVYNVDQDGNNHLPGKLEVTSEDLLLHNKKNETISWPIRTLRRYGYDGELFSFESGRRCHTGEGIFGFRCDQAEQLFRLLQANIQRSSNNSSLNTTGNNPILQRSNNDSSTNSRGSSRILYTSSGYFQPRNTRLQSEGSTTSGPRSPSSHQVSPSNVYNFEPIDAEKSSDASPSNQVDGSNIGSPLYINVPAGSENDESNTIHDAYEYLFDKPDKHYPPPLTILSSNNELMLEKETPDKLEYIILSLDGESSAPTLKTSTKTQEESRSPSYSTIDFQKTWALLQSTKPNIENDIGCTRRTRHNSTLFDIQTPNR